MKRDRLEFALFTLTCLCIAGCGERELPPSGIIVISLDACRADRMSLYGYERDTTPNLRALAEESLVFERAYTTQPYTLSHLSTLTGLYPSQHGVVEGTALAEAVPTLAQRLQVEGYQTAGLYHQGWIHPRFGFDRGFDTFRKHVGVDQCDDHLNDVMDAWKNKPFFLFLHLFDIHCGNLDESDMPVYDPAAPYDSMFVRDARARMDGLPAREVYYDREPLTAPQHEALEALYDGGIAHIDARLGRWIEEWRASGVLDRSLLIITADHGEALGMA